MEITDISPEVDKYCDYIPFVSTVTNLAALFVKAISSLIENYKRADLIPNYHYFSYIQKEKKAWHCAILLIPFFGNLYVAMYPKELTLKEMDKVCEYLPFISTFANIVDLFIKTICSLVENYKGKDRTVSHHYFSYLHNEKSALRCAILLIPIFGNLYILTHLDRVVKKVEKKEIIVSEKMEKFTLPIAKEENVDMKAEKKILVGVAEVLYCLFLSVRPGDSEGRLPNICEKEVLFNQKLSQFTDAGGEISDKLLDYFEKIQELKSHFSVVSK